MASLFLAAYEVLREQIVGRTKAFFSDHFTIDGPQESAEYKQRILAGQPNAFVGAVAWLQGMDVLTSDDAAVLKQIRDQRNALAHDLPSVIFGRELGIDVELLNKTRELVIRVGRFWARVDIDISEEFDGREIADDEIQPGAAVMLEHIVRIAVEAIDRAAT